MDTAFFADYRSPFISADIAAVTLAGTDKALYPAANSPQGGYNFNSFIGKKYWLRLFGRMTTGASPGNLTFDIYWGTGADANGTIIGSSAAIAMTASQTNKPWYLDATIHARALGSSGSLFFDGEAGSDTAIIASTAQPILILGVAGAAAAVTVDLTAANIISVQVKESGTPSATMQVHDFQVLALN